MDYYKVRFIETDMMESATPLPREVFFSTDRHITTKDVEDWHYKEIGNVQGKKLVGSTVLLAIKVTYI